MFIWVVFVFLSLVYLHSLFVFSPPHRRAGVRLAVGLLHLDELSQDELLGAVT